MAIYPFYLASVFCDKSGSGDPIVIFMISEWPTDHEMQMMAYQMNGSEVAFLHIASSVVRFFHPQFCLPFSAKGLLAAAAVMQTEQKLMDTAKLELSCSTGSYELLHETENFTLLSPAGRTRPNQRSLVEVAFSLGIESREVIPPLQFIDTGVEQLMVQVRARQTVLQAKPHAALLSEYAASPKQVTQAVIWQREGDLITLRSFTADHFNIYEDFGSGVAALNIASGHLAIGGKLPFSVKIEQGHTIEKLLSRLSHQYLEIDNKLDLHLKAKVQLLGSGTLKA